MSMQEYLILSTILFAIGCFGMFTARKHILIIFISLELLLLAINFNFVFFSLYIDDFTGIIFMLLVFTVAAAEISLGLAILIVYYRLRGGVKTNLIKLLKA